MSSRKDIAIAFLEGAATGDVDSTYEKYVHPDFIHHNAYFKSDRETLRIAMKENQQEFPDKEYSTLRALEDGDLATVHGKIVIDGKTYSVIHIVRFEGDKIIELWEGSQEVLEDSPNEKGIF